MDRDLMIKKMWVATSALGYKSVENLAELIEYGYVADLSLVLAEQFLKDEIHPTKMVPYLYDVLDLNDPENGIKVQISWASSHLKSVHFETEDGLFFNFTGSMNMRTNRNIELFTIRESQTLYKFMTENVLEVIEETFFSINTEKGRPTTFEGVKKQYSEMPEISKDWQKRKETRDEIRELAKKHVTLSSVRGQTVWLPISEKIAKLFPNTNFAKIISERKKKKNE